MAVPAPGKGIRFGVFEVDPRSGELRKHGVRIRLQEQPFKILLALLERQGEVVSREELRERIWGNDTSVDFDHGLSAAVNRLREALGDSADNPRFVETLARRGYRFIGALEGPPEAEPVPAPVPVAAPPRRRLAWVAMACAGVAAVASGIGLWLVRRAPALPPIRVVPLTTFPGIESQPAFSPDGKQVAFTWNGEKQDNIDIYVKMVGSVAPLRVTTDPAADVSPAWSPDGNQIAFVRVKPGVSAVMLVSRLGGADRKLTDVRLTRAPALAWSREGKHLAVAGLDLETKDAGIVLVPLDGGERWRLTSHREAGFDGSPSFSPDGRFLAYLSGKMFAFDVMLQELSPDLAPKGQARRLTKQGVSVLGLAWTADGLSLVYSASHEAGTAHYLWRVSADGAGQPERVEIAGPQATFPATALTGNRLAYAKGIFDSDIWKWEAGSPISEFLVSTRSETSPEFSPDGTRIAFASSRAGGGSEIWVCNRDGSNLTQLTNGLGRHQGTPRWSPDGRFLAFDSQNQDGTWDIYVMDAAGGTPRRLTAAPSDEAIASYSRDGNWIYFCSDRSGRAEVWRASSGGGEWEQQTDNGGCAARESWDGKTLYYDKFGLGIQAAVPLFAKASAGGPEGKVVEAVMTRNFRPVKDGIYYIAPPAIPGQEFRLMFHDFATNKSRPVTPLAKRNQIGLTVSPDGKTFLFTVPKAASQDLMLVENFR